MREISITTDKRLFTRVPPAKEKVLQAMRNDLMKMYPEEEYDWSTGVVNTEIIRDSGCRCNDKIKVTLKVENLIK